MPKTPWAVLLCKFKDNDSEPFNRNFYERFFTTAGAGSQNMVDYFRAVSHGTTDVSDSEVFGWFTLNKNRSDYTGSGPNWKGRQQLVDWAKAAAIEAGVNLDTFYGVVVCMNVPTDLFGGGGRQAVCDNLSMQPSLLGQEMGHGYGLEHSRADGSDDDYRDQWDIMSTRAAFMAPHPEYELIGPILNAWNMRGRGWLDESRVWKGSATGYDATTVDLRPLHRRDVPGLLAAEVGDGYLVEFRMREEWDGGIPQSAVVIHRFEDNHSYIMRGTRGQHDLVAGDVFQVGVSGSLAHPFTRVEVVAIDEASRTATLRLEYRPLHIPIDGPRRKFQVELVVGEAGGVFGGVHVDAGGWIIVGGKIIPVPPWDPTLQILEQIALFRASELATQPQARDTIRREALTAITTYVEELLVELQPFHVPAPPLQELQQQ